MMLFSDGKLRSSSGLDLSWKIECDSLSGSDLSCLARLGVALLYKRLYVAGPVNPARMRFIGVPSGGIRIADAMSKAAALYGPETDGLTADPFPIVVDDVLTTGKSMVDIMRKHNYPFGFVLFCRNPQALPHNAEALFMLNSLSPA